MLASEEVISKMPLWKAKAARGELTDAELEEAVKVLRGGRMSALEATAPARTSKAKKVVVDADALAQELLNM